MALKSISPTRILGLFALSILALTVSAQNAPQANHSLLSKGRKNYGAPMEIGQIKPSRLGVKDVKNPLFLPAVTYGSGGAYPTAMAVVDLNGDGKPDLVVANEFCFGCGDSDSRGRVGVLLANGDGTFQTPVPYDSGGYSASSVVVADVNRDGKPDLIVTDVVTVCNVYCSGDGSANVLLGNGDGTFQPPVTYDSGAFGAIWLAVADLNGDGKLDLVVANSCGGAEDCSAAVSVLLGNGDGTFQPPIVYGSNVGGAQFVALADINGDGKLDMLVAYAISCEVCQSSTGVLLGNGDGTFQPTIIYSGVGGGTVTVADVNGDGKPDLLVTSGCISNSNCGNGTVGVLLGKGDGTFQSAVAYYSGGYQADSVAIADVNGDGKPDLLVANGCFLANTDCEDNPVGVLLGNGDGTFQTVATYASGGFDQTSIAAADVNGDGRSDLLVLNSCGDSRCDNGPALGVLLNNTGPHSSTTIKVQSSLNPSAFGQLVTFSAVVRSRSGTPTGTVIFSDGSTILGSSTLFHGKASWPVPLLLAGSHSITAAYQESLHFDPSTSVPLDQIVNRAITTNSLSVAPNPSRIYQFVSYSSTLTSPAGVLLMGTVTFQDSGIPIATVTVSGNAARYFTKYPQRGSHAITATYSGDSNNVGSTSAMLTEYIGNFPVQSKTVLTTSDSPSIVGIPVTFTATISPTDLRFGAIPDGELVTFYDGMTTIRSVQLTGGTATYTISSLSAKGHTIKAIYAGDAIFKTSTGSVRQVVNP
jgi:hypothetical protein